MKTLASITRAIPATGHFIRTLVSGDSLSPDHIERHVCSPSTAKTNLALGITRVAAANDSYALFGHSYPFF